MSMTISVIIPNYNHAKYLRERIDSVLNQTYKDYELIILDDCSTDDSRKIIDDYTLRFPFIKSYYNTSNSGSPFIQWDFGVNKAKGEFIWIAESDDFAEPCFLEKASSIMIKYENVGLVHTDSKVIDEQYETEYLVSEKKALLISNKWQSDYFNNGKDEISNHLFLENSIYNVSGVLFRKSKYSESGGVGHSMKFCGDWLLYIRILLISDIAYISLPLNTFRIHKGSSGNQYFNNKNYLTEIISVYSFVTKKISLSPKKKFLIAKKVFIVICRRLKHFVKNQMLK
jgi:glycosyltransferase involved in cell wall biosynthesis